MKEKAESVVEMNAVTTEAGWGKSRGKDRQMILQSLKIILSGTVTLETEQYCQFELVLSIFCLQIYIRILLFVNFVVPLCPGSLSTCLVSVLNG